MSKPTGKSAFADSETPISLDRTTQAVIERKGKLQASARSVDTEFWLRQGSAQNTAPAWELVVLPQTDVGGALNELELQGTIEAFKPVPLLSDSEL